MSFKKVTLVLFLILFLLPACKIHAATSNAGFVPGSIWYSKDPFAEGDTVKIYTLIFNPDKRELSGTVVFFDREILLGKKDFIVSSQAAKDFSIDWTATSGSHSIYAKIENAKFLVSKGKYVAADLAETQTPPSLRTVSKNGELPASSTDYESIRKIGKTVESYTPAFISKPIITLANGAEEFRTSLGAKTGSFIFNNKFIFYGIVLVILFFIFRYVWNKFL